MLFENFKTLIQVHLSLKETTDHDIGNIVVTFATNRSNTQSMASGTVHIVHCDVISAGDSYTVILIVDSIVDDQGIIRSTDVESVRIMSCRKPATDCVWRIACAVIKQHVSHCQVGTARYAEEMSWPVLNMQIFDH
jgi:hypothetical protein